MLVCRNWFWILDRTNDFTLRVLRRRFLCNIIQKALRADDAHSREDVVCRKRPRSARECALHILFFAQTAANQSKFLLTKVLFVLQCIIQIIQKHGRKGANIWL